MRRRIWVLAGLVLWSIPMAGALPAQEGQADLDKAAELQLTAETLGEMERVIQLAESALQKGLDPGQQQFAKKLLAATLYQHAKRASDAIFERRRPDPRWAAIREQALKNLQKAKQYDDSLPDVYLLEARLQAELPRGDRQAAMAALDRAIALLKDNPPQLSKAYVLRGRYHEDAKQKLADFEKAAQADPKNIEAGQGLALLYLQNGENEKAVAILQKLVEQDADNPNLLAVLAETLIDLKKYDEALKYCDNLVQQAPRSTIAYNLRARVRMLKDDLDGAIRDLDEALAIDENDKQALLLRGNLHRAKGNDAQAEADVQKLLKLDPELPQAILLRSLLAAQKKDWGRAISDLQTLLQTDPTNPRYRLQLAAYYVGDHRPRRAIDLLTQILEGLGEEAEDRELKADALRARGDALLSVGRHADAIRDYEEALKIDPNDTGVLNNLAWVLATSPEDELRDAERSIALGTKACELTNYSRPHILSTLAAGYAEKGDWETAIKWSSKAVELGSKDKDEDDVLDQLQKELESYKQRKPWREKQVIEENTRPLGQSSKSDLET
jgi:tetratricopeptide (TPR) repeat protein